MTTSSEKGSALWFILLAIALLTALTVTISRVSDTVDQSGDIERLRVYASDLMRYAASVEQAVERMRLRGLSENEISFQNSATIADYTNPRCGSDDCLIFGTGGGLAYNPPPTDITTSDWVFTGENAVQDVFTSNSDLLMMLEISDALCTRINAELGIAGTPVIAAADTTTPYVGTFGDGTIIIDQPVGKKTGCVTIASTPYFYHTLITR